MLPFEVYQAALKIKENIGAVNPDLTKKTDIKIVIVFSRQLGSLYIDTAQLK